MKTDICESFLKLVRLGVGESSDATTPIITDWLHLKELAEEQGLSSVLLDGVNACHNLERPPKEFLLNWIGEVLQGESFAKLQWNVATDMAGLFHNYGIKTYILKGFLISECYPKPNHRVSVDVDCFLLSSKDGFNAWALGNDLIRSKGVQVNTDFYKNSSFEISGVMVENHQYLVPFRGNKRLMELEKFFQSQMKVAAGMTDDSDNIYNSKFENTLLYRPPVMVTALFLIEHAYSHFLHEGLTWRMVLDWVLFSRKHNEEIDWASFDAVVEEYGLWKFYDSYNRLGMYFIGEVHDSNLTPCDKRMLEDIWSKLDLHETVKGVRGKLALAGNTWRARWKYRYFTEMNWLQALLIQMKGFLFDKHPHLY